MKCKKCGSDDILTRHVKAGDLINSSSTSRVEDRHVTSIEYDFFYKLKAKAEHLKKHCRNCQYSWREDTKDI